MLAFYRALLLLRRTRPDLTDGRRDRTQVDVDEAAGTVVVRREATAAAVNLSGEPRVVAVPGSLLVASDPGASTDGTGAVRLPPWSAAVLDLRP